MQFQFNSTLKHTILMLTLRRVTLYTKKEADIKIYEMVVV